MNREERSRAQKELDKCEKQIREIQTQKQIEYNTAQTKLENLQHESSQLQAECKTSQMQLAETKVTNANLQNQLENANREMSGAQVEISRLHAGGARDGRFADTDGEIQDGRDAEASQVLHEAQEEINRVQSHYENELAQYKQERVELASKIQGLLSQNERLKLESTRQLSSYKSKYTDYKTKLRKANQNISTLLTRLAKFDIAIQAEREERVDGIDAQHPPYGQNMQNFPDYDQGMNFAMGQAVGQNYGHNININDMIANDGLNEEIKKLLAEQAN